MNMNRTCLTIRFDDFSFHRKIQNKTIQKITHLVIRQQSQFFFDIEKIEREREKEMTSSS